MKHVLPVVFMLGAVVGVAACYGPTEVRVEVTRDVACAPYGATSTAIFVGPPGRGPVAPTAETLDCTTTPDGASLGSIVVVPSGDRTARVTVEVALTFDPKNKSAEACLSDAKGCIVARRSFAFIPHSARTLPIKLYEDCRDKTCATGSTCVAGQCVSDDVESATFCESREACGLPPADAGVDAAPVPADAGLDAADAAVPGPCGGPKGDGILLDDVDMPTGKLVAGPTAIYWPAQSAVAAASKQGGPAQGAGGESPILAIEVSGDTLWFVENARFHRVKAITSVSPMRATFALADVNTIALTSTLVYVAAPTGIFTVAIDAPTGAEPLPLPGNSITATTRLAATSSYVYAFKPGSLLRLQGSSALVFGAQSSAGDVVAGPSGVFFGDLVMTGTSATVWGLADLNNDAPKPVAQAISPAALAHDGTTLYWTDAVTGGDNTQVWKRPGGAKVQVPIANVPSIVGLAVDSQCVYYWGGVANGKGAIRVAPK